MPRVGGWLEDCLSHEIEGEQLASAIADQHPFMFGGDMAYEEKVCWTCPTNYPVLSCYMRPYGFCRGLPDQQNGGLPYFRLPLTMTVEG